MERQFAGMSAAELVAALYRAFLRRDPDPEGAQDKVEKLLRGDHTVADIIAEFITSSEFANCNSSTKLISDQTQYGEFERLLQRWTTLAVGAPLVVDVGARGKARSNSWDLLKFFKWRGILIEANPSLTETINADFTDLDFELIQCAVSDFEGEATFYLGVNDDVSSLNLETSEGWGPTAGEVTVPVRRLGKLLDERSVPSDFALLSIDIEGEDIRVLNDLIENTVYRPRWVIIEASYDFSTRSLADLPFTPSVLSNYKMIDQTQANLILEFNR